MSARTFVVMVNVDVEGVEQEDTDAWRVIRHALWDAWDESRAGNVVLHVLSISEPQGEPAP